MTTIRKLYIFNFAGACIVAAAWWAGYVDKLMHADAAHMTKIIAALFLVGLVSTFWQARKVDKAARQKFYNGPASRERASSALALAAAHLRDIYTALFILGIVGNAVGFLIAFSGVSMASMGSADGMQEAGVKLLSGAGTAFGATIVGLSLALWMSANLRILHTAIDRLR